MPDETRSRAAGATARTPPPCPRCGTPIPRDVRLCAPCVEKETPSQRASHILINWLAFLALMAVIFGGGALLVP